VTAPLSKYGEFHTRICRPVDLSADDRARVCRFAVAQVGLDYDLKNVIDLACHLLPLPKRWRQRATLGAHNPRRIICSTLIAQAFASVGFAILPQVSAATSPRTRSDVTAFTDATHCAPRDFDLSPYFEVIKLRHEVGQATQTPARLETAGTAFVPPLVDLLSAREQAAPV